MRGCVNKTGSIWKKKRKNILVSKESRENVWYHFYNSEYMNVRSYEDKVIIHKWALATWSTFQGVMNGQTHKIQEQSIISTKHLPSLSGAHDTILLKACQLY